MDIKLHHQIWLCYTPVETPSLSGSYDPLNEIQTPRSVQQSTAWPEPCLTFQRHLLPLFPHPTYFSYTGLLEMSWMCVPWLLLPLLRPLGVLLIYLRGSCWRFLHSLNMWPQAGYWTLFLFLIQKVIMIGCAICQRFLMRIATIGIVYSRLSSHHTSEKPPLIIL